MRLIATALAAAALAAPTASAVEHTVRVPVANCHVTVAVTDVALLLSNPPQLRTSGDTGAWTDCP